MIHGNTAPVQPPHLNTLRNPYKYEIYLFTRMADHPSPYVCIVLFKTDTPMAIMIPKVCA